MGYVSSLTLGREAQVDSSVAGIEPTARDDLAAGKEVNAFTSMGVGVAEE